LARALAWHARGHRFESGILHRTGQRQIFEELSGFLLTQAGVALLSVFNFSELAIKNFFNTSLCTKTFSKRGALFSILRG
jgi:hypothetical protein